MSSAVVLIIVHKAAPSQNELASLRQCKTILGDHPIVLICPKGLNIAAYQAEVSDITAHFIDPEWQRSYGMFNRLKISPLLYFKYRKYEYILFYELDAWVFRDELAYWCNQGYDYIGAPWFEGMTEATPESTFFGVGNGGLSLRNVKSHLKALCSFSYLVGVNDLLVEFNKNRSMSGVKRLIANLTYTNNTFYLFNDFMHNEDLFWGKVIREKFPWFKVPEMHVASQFSMEINAPKLYYENGNKLPFGCHKWEQYSPEFWRQFIKI